MLRHGILALIALLFSVSAFAQANGKLQIHYMDVGQGDGAVLISPLGEVVLFDDGVLNQCGKPIAYLQTLGISKIDYHIASHYHSDHIGCAASIFQLFPLQKAAYDRGGSYTTAAYSTYVNAVGSKRLTAQKGQTITLDAGSASPVTITFLAVNGNGVTTTDENDLSLVAVVRFGQFDAEFGGDLSGAGTRAADPECECLLAIGTGRHHEWQRIDQRYRGGEYWKRAKRHGSRGRPGRDGQPGRCRDDTRRTEHLREAGRRARECDRRL
jgi:beta-lactamase superfamily II metal-dependent hydrolase